MGSPLRAALAPSPRRRAGVPVGGAGPPRPRRPGAGRHPAGRVAPPRYGPEPALPACAPAAQARARTAISRRRCRMRCCCAAAGTSTTPMLTPSSWLRSTATTNWLQSMRSSRPPIWRPRHEHDHHSRVGEAHVAPDAPLHAGAEGTSCYGASGMRHHPWSGSRRRRTQRPEPRCPETTTTRLPEQRPRRPPTLLTTRLTTRLAEHLAEPLSHGHSGTESTATLRVLARRASRA